MQNSPKTFGQRFRGVLAALSVMSAAMPALPNRADAQAPGPQNAPAASVLPELPPMPEPTATFNRELWGAVPAVRGDGNLVVVSYPDRETQTRFSGGAVTITTVFHDRLNNQDVTISQGNLPMGSAQRFESLRLTAESQLGRAPRGNLSNMRPDDRERLTTAIVYTQLDDMNAAREALQRAGTARAGVTVQDGPPAAPAALGLLYHFGSSAPPNLGNAPMRNPNAAAAVDDGDERGVSRVGREGRSTIVRYDGPIMAVSTEFVDRTRGKAITIRVTLQRGGQLDFVQARDNLARVLDQTVPSMRDASPAEKQALAGAMVLGQLLDVRAATEAQKRLPGNSNAANLDPRRDMTITNAPENPAATLAPLAQRFGAAPPLQQNGPRPPSPMPLTPNNGPQRT